jgi:hypothetical protein
MLMFWPLLTCRQAALRPPAVPAGRRSAPCLLAGTRSRAQAQAGRLFHVRDSQHLQAKFQC